MADDADLSPETVGFVKLIDKRMGSKYGVSLQVALSDPSVITKSSNAKVTIENLRNEANNYFDSLLASMENEKKRFTSELVDMDALYKKLNDLIRTKSAGASIPFVKPVSVDRDENKDESIVVEKYDVAVELLVNKLVSASDYVADISTKYNDYTIGAWLFSGSKNHVLAVNPPSSAILNIEASRDEINFALDDMTGAL